MGGLHMRLAAAHDRARLTAVCDINTDLLKLPVNQLGAQTFTDHRAMIDAQVVDAVSLGLPHCLHAPVALDFLRTGVHVLVEKPLAIRPSECDAMIAAAEQRHLHLAVMHQYRLHPLTQRIKQIIDAGEIGPVHHVLWTWHQFRTGAYFTADAWHSTYAGAGGGVIMLQCVHDLDLLCHLLGEPARVGAVLGTQVHEVPLEDLAAMQIVFRCGAVATVQCSVTRPRGASLRQLTGDRGIVIVDDLQGMTDAHPERLRVGRSHHWQACCMSLITRTTSRRSPGGMSVWAARCGTPLASDWSAGVCASLAASRLVTTR